MTKKFGDVVRERRRQLSLSQEELAAKAGVSVRGLRKIEANLVRTPRPATVRLLADGLGLLGADRDAFCQTAASTSIKWGDARAANQQLRELTEHSSLIGPLGGPPIRRGLVDELGTEPAGPLPDSHRLILRGELVPGMVLGSGADPSRRVSPAQLPVDAAGFTGRSEEMDALDAICAAAEDGPPKVVIALVSGTAGVGKTALAVHWAHQAAHRFPDGQLYVDLRGYDPAHPLEPGTVLSGFLTALGVPRPEVPADASEQSARYRTEISRRRMLIVLDNAATVDQLRPLLPGTGPCLVLITSRDSLAGLVALCGARRLDLDLLPGPDAIKLLRHLIGPRVDAEPDAAATLAEQCSRLPLALRVAAERAAFRHDTPLAEFATELAHPAHRLNLLEAGADPRGAVAAVFSWSYRQLPAAAARLFRLLGLHPGTDVDAYAAAALAGIPLHQVRRLLDVLARAHLVQTAHMPTAGARYGMHDLLRAYAAHLAQAEESPDQRRAALTRLFDYYLGTAALAVSIYRPVDERYRPRIDPVAIDTHPLSGPDAAMAWLDIEQPTLLAICVHAAMQGWPGHATSLVITLAERLDATAYHADSLRIHDMALDAARRTGDRLGEARILTNLGHIHWWGGRHRLAVEHHHRAAEICRGIGDRNGEARILMSLGRVDERAGRYREALDYHRHALAIASEIDDRPTEARALINLGTVYGRLRQYDIAAEQLERGLAACQLLGDQHAEINARSNLGVVRKRQAQYGSAITHYRRALHLARTLGYRPNEVHVLVNLGTLSEEIGKREDAVRYLRQATALADEIRTPYSQATAHHDLALVLMRAGRPAEALAEFNAALRYALTAGDSTKHADALAGIGHALAALTGNRPGVRRYWHDAIAIYRELGSQHEDDIADLRTALAKLSLAEATSQRHLEMR